MWHGPRGTVALLTRVSLWPIWFLHSCVSAHAGADVNGHALRHADRGSRGEVDPISRTRNELGKMLSLRKILFGLGIGKPMIATGNSLSGECRLGHGRDFIKVG